MCSAEKSDIVRNLIKDSRCDVICIQETKRNKDELKYTSRVLPSFFERNCVILSAKESLGGCLISWKRSFLLLNSWVSEHTCSTVLLQKNTGAKLVVTNAYGPLGETSKYLFFKEICYIATLVSTPWVLAGDFNVVRWIRDWSGAMRNFNNMSQFNEVIMDLQLIDVPLRNKTFTWTNKQPSPIFSKLYRIFLSPELSLIFPIITLQALPMTVSDHVPLLLTCKQKQPIKQGIKMELGWFKYDILKTKVNANWEDGKGNSLTQFTKRAEWVQIEMEQWHKSNFSGVQLQLDYCKKQILAMDCLEERRTLSQDEFQSRIKWRDRAYELAILIETRWKQRARCKWLKKGDRNTRFFHAFASTRSRKNTVISLTQGDRTVSDQENLAKAFHNSLKGILGGSKQNQF